MTAHPARPPSSRETPLQRRPGHVTPRPAAWGAPRRALENAMSSSPATAAVANCSAGAAAPTRVMGITLSARDVDGLALGALGRARTQPRRRPATMTSSPPSVLRSTHRGRSQTDTIANDGAVSPPARRRAFSARRTRRRLQTVAPSRLHSSKPRLRCPLITAASTSTPHSLPATWQSTAPTREDRSRQVEPHGDDPVNQIPIAPRRAQTSSGGFGRATSAL